MAILRHVASGDDHFLSPRHLIGRAPACQLRINDSGVSGFHAELLWDGERWSAKDLGSRNGTAVGERPLAKGEPVPLEPGAELVLAGRIRFCFVDGSAPHLIATSASGEVRTAQDELLCLPSDEDPQLTIYRDIDGQWQVESDTETKPLDEAVTLMVGAEPWRVLSPRLLPMTLQVGGERLLADHTLAFRVSRDGEHIELALTREGQPLSLEPRAHLALWLLLARERLRDAEGGELPPSEQGWVHREDLPKLLGVQAGLIKLWIHRGRRQLAEAGLRDAAAIIEQRAGSTQVRIGAPRLSVEDG